MDTLIIRAELSNPPSETLAFRSLTMMAKEIKLDNLIEIEQDYKDIYYNYLKWRGLMDYVQQIITPSEKEGGIRIGLPNHTCTIKIDRITFRNMIGILGEITAWRGNFGSL